MQATRRCSLKALAAVLAPSFPCAHAQQPATDADWLVLVYMNGKNNLCADALSDFREMAQVGSTDRVSIVVQLGRTEDSKYNPSIADGWSGVKRFHIKKDMTPSEKEALMHIGAARDKAADMGNPAVLDDFVSWGLKTFPARNRILVIWNHGQGWRFSRASAALKATLPPAGRLAAPIREMAGIPAPSTFRSVSNDDEHHSVLYNKQVQTVLEKHASAGTRFNIVAYDACLMAMVETVYSLRGVTDYVVGSQELEPGAGWQHTTLLSRLVTNPAMSAEDYAKTVVATYKDTYGNYDRTTLSATRTAAIGDVSNAISVCSRALIASKSQSYAELKNVRGTLAGFADYWGLGFGVDCESLFARLAASAAPAEVRTAAQAVVTAMKGAVVANYASTETARYSPMGLALYFPSSKAEFDRDPERKGYLRSNTQHPVDFVRDSDWSLLLRDYLALPK